MESHRQGDIGFFEIPKVPEGYELTGTVLEVLGETGLHVHRIEGVRVYGSIAPAERPGIAPVQERTDEESEFGLPLAIIRAFEGGPPVIHNVLGDNEQPHDNLTLPPGLYEVRQARRYTDEGIRQAD